MDCKFLYKCEGLYPTRFSFDLTWKNDIQSRSMAFAYTIQIATFPNLPTFYFYWSRTR